LPVASYEFQVTTSTIPSPLKPLKREGMAGERKSNAKIETNREYVRTEQEKPNPPPWEKSYWEVVKQAMGLGKRSGLELLTKLSFFSRRPLRTITKMGLEGVG